MVLLDPAMKQALSPLDFAHRGILGLCFPFYSFYSKSRRDSQKSQGMMCKGWRGCTRVVLPSHGVLTGKGRLANHGGGDASERITTLITRHFL